MNFKCSALWSNVCDRRLQFVSPIIILSLSSWSSFSRYDSNLSKISTFESGGLYQVVTKKGLDFGFFNWCEDYEFSSYKSCQSSPFNSIPIDVRYCFVLLALTSPPVMIPYLKMTPQTNKYFESDPPDKSPPPPSQVINDQTLNTHYYCHVCTVS